MGMSLKPLKPDTVPPAFSSYAQAMETAPGLRWLHISGQVGVTPDGTLEAGAEAQIEQAWRNVLALLDAAGMSTRNLVKTTAYLVRGEDTDAFRRVRERVLDGAAPASTLVVVAALARPDWLVEIEAEAAAPA
jgi:2-iminobutanoate/2-iminopropanoate deaminase